MNELSCFQEVIMNTDSSSALLRITYPEIMEDKDNQAPPSIFFYKIHISSIRKESAKLRGSRGFVDCTGYVSAYAYG